MSISKNFKKGLFAGLGLLALFVFLGVGPSLININQIASPGFAPNATAIYVSPNCSINSANCQSVYDDVQVASQATFSTSSNTITTASTDPPFVASDANNGKIAFGTGNCTSANPANCYNGLSQVTITAFNNAHSITVSSDPLINCTPSITNACYFAWGHDDTTGLKAANTSSIAQNLPIVLPCGRMFFQSMPFFNPSSNVLNTTRSLSGCSKGTTLIPTPNFDYTSCNHGCFWYDGQNAGNNIYQVGAVYDHLKDFTINGLGWNASLASDSLSVIATATETEIDNVEINAWNENTAHVFPGFHLKFAHMVGGGSYGGGNPGIECDGVAITDPVPTELEGVMGGAGGQSRQGLLVINGHCIVKGGWYYIGSASGNTAAGIEVDGGRLDDFGSFTSFIYQTGGEANLDNTILTYYEYVLTGGELHIHDVKNTNNYGGGNYPGIVQTGGNVYDECGNLFAVAPTPLTGHWFGSCSADGSALTTGNVALTSGWDSSTVSAVGDNGNNHRGSFTISLAGSPGSSNVVTLTFPNAAGYVIPPVCVWSQNSASTGAIPSSLQPGTTTTTTASVTVNGTFSASTTEILQYNCQ